MNFSLELEYLARTGPDILLKLIAAMLCGGIVGFERETKGKSVGLRTCILVCLGATIFTLLSERMAEMFGGDPTRIASQIVPGVGFLGAGVIMRELGRGITGLTTAAIVWVVAAIGMMIGSGLLLTALGSSLLIVLVIYSLRRFERTLHARRAPHYQLAVSSQSEDSLNRIRSLATIYRDEITDLQVTEAKEENQPAIVQFRFVGSNNERYDFLKLVYEIPNVNIIGD